jgi:hypothetical protein
MSFINNDETQTTPGLSAIGCCVFYPTSAHLAQLSASAHRSRSPRLPERDRGQKQPMWVLTVGLRCANRHLSLSRKQVPRVQHHLKNSDRLRNIREQICELIRNYYAPSPTARDLRRRTRLDLRYIQGIFGDGFLPIRGRAVGRLDAAGDSGSRKMTLCWL